MPYSFSSASISSSSNSSRLSWTNSSSPVAKVILLAHGPERLHVATRFRFTRNVSPVLRRVNPMNTGRSEEHTSELQSRPHLVCRLLLEKKNREYSAPCVVR